MEIPHLHKPATKFKETNSNTNTNQIRLPLHHISLYYHSTATHLYTASGSLVLTGQVRNTLGPTHTEETLIYMYHIHVYSMIEPHTVMYMYIVCT